MNDDRYSEAGMKAAHDAGFDAAKRGHDRDASWQCLMTTDAFDMDRVLRAPSGRILTATRCATPSAPAIAPTPRTKRTATPMSGPPTATRA